MAKMLNTETLFLFIFIFSILVITRVVILVIGSLTSKEPKPLNIGRGELITLGLLTSYFITYLIKLL
jgi:hypothetical protein